MIRRLREVAYRLTSPNHGSVMADSAAPTEEMVLTRARHYAKYAKIPELVVTIIGADGQTIRTETVRGV